MGDLLLSTTLAGVVGTGLGGVVGALFRKDSNRTVSLLLSFAGGVMISIVCFDLIEEAIRTGSGIVTVVFGVCVGIAVVYLLNYLIDRKANAHIPHIDQTHPKTADALDELTHANSLNERRRRNDSKASLFVAGIVMACAIALHNVPEGMTIGASFVRTDHVLSGTSLVLAVLIGLHNIPEGMAVVVPLISGGMKRRYAILITAISGAPTILGAIFGYWLGDIGPFGLALSLSFASGAMLYVVFGEILPQAILMYRSKLPTFSITFGMMVGLLMIYL
ncbi:MAG: ZIP family metal transporter [Sphaerochaetaceae bacterium]|nr:ZIP family metal transporter [Sphaerochaetaceae bacterium]